MPTYKVADFGQRGYGVKPGELVLTVDLEVYNATQTSVSRLLESFTWRKRFWPFSRLRQRPLEVENNSAHFQLKLIDAYYSTRDGVVSAKLQVQGEWLSQCLKRLSSEVDPTDGGKLTRWRERLEDVCRESLETKLQTEFISHGVSLGKPNGLWSLWFYQP